MPFYQILKFLSTNRFLHNSIEFLIVLNVILRGRSNTFYVLFIFFYKISTNFDGAS
jgi:hypothetical protein